MVLLAELAEDWDRLDDEERLIRSAIPGRVRLGVPARFVDQEGVEWAGFDDGRIDATDAAYYGALRAHPELVADYHPESDADIEVVRATVRSRLQSVVREPPAEDVTERSALAHQQHFDAQDSGATVRFLQGRPPSWRPGAGDDLTPGPSPRAPAGSGRPDVSTVGRTTSRAVRLASIDVAIKLTDTIIDADSDASEVAWAEMLQRGLVHLRGLVEQDEIPTPEENALAETLRRAAQQVVKFAVRGGNLANLGLRVLEALSG